jgi:hypothetical protein
MKQCSPWRNSSRRARLMCNTLPTKAASPSPFVGVSTHTHITLLTLSSSLRVKGLTRGWYCWLTKAYKLAPPLLNKQCGTKHAHQRSWATHGPSNLGRVWHSPPSKNPMSSSVQLTRIVPTHTPCRVPHPRPTRACICPHTDPSKCPGTFPLSARPYVQCRPICHAVCPISGPHTPCPYVRTLTRTRNHEGRLWYHL